MRLTKCRINITSESERRIVIQESFEKALTQVGLQESASQRVAAPPAFSMQDEQEDQQEPQDQDDVYAPADEDDLDEREEEEQSDEQADEDDLDETEEQDDENDLDDQETDPLLMLDLEETTLDLLVESGFSSLEDIASSSIEDLTSIPGIDYRKALRLLEQARQFLEIPQSQISEVRTDE